VLDETGVARPSHPTLTADCRFLLNLTFDNYFRVHVRHGARSASLYLAAVGSAESISQRLQNYLDAGATDVVLRPLV